MFGNSCPIHAQLYKLTAIVLYFVQNNGQVKKIKKNSYFEQVIPGFKVKKS